MGMEKTMLVIQGLGTRRKEHKYELKRSLNIQANETPESLIESIDPIHIVNHEEFENNTRYWCDPTVQSKKNKESREKQILQGLLHTTGSRSFARSAYEEESITGWGPNRSMLLRKTHTHKDGKPVTKKAESKMVGLVCPDSVAHVEEDDGDENDIEDETNE
ncbi:hypothetical protein FH972_019900 [Carpinus fangiana]|uniref:Uncharacterized protein n=1 Tax=Carpinus fangiana TaxID=176857 RepID=A0A5N6RV20_9ROSI|nr:hypothetical protein FH972_019900 [Carpinus fangiana]